MVMRCPSDEEDIREWQKWIREGRALVDVQMMMIDKRIEQGVRIDNEDIATILSSLSTAVSGTMKALEVALAKIAELEER
jgi:hypothetical protein